MEILGITSNKRNAKGNQPFIITHSNGTEYHIPPEAVEKVQKILADAKAKCYTTITKKSCYYPELGEKLNFTIDEKPEIFASKINSEILSKEAPSIDVSNTKLDPTGVSTKLDPTGVITKLDPTGVSTKLDPTGVITKLDSKTGVITKLDTETGVSTQFNSKTTPLCHYYLERKFNPLLFQKMSDEIAVKYGLVIANDEPPPNPGKPPEIIGNGNDVNGDDDNGDDVNGDDDNGDDVNGEIIDGSDFNGNDVIETKNAEKSFDIKKYLPFAIIAIVIFVAMFYLKNKN